MMAKPEVSREGMKELTHAEQGQIELKVPALGSGRLQSEISLKQKEGYGQHAHFKMASNLLALNLWNHQNLMALLSFLLHKHCEIVHSLNRLLAVLLL